MRSGAAIAAHDGVFLARGGRYVQLEGRDRARNVVARFPSLEAAVACYNSAEYQAALSQPMTWLAAIVRNRCLDQLRRRELDTVTMTTDDDDGKEFDLPSGDPTPVETVSDIVRDETPCRRIGALPCCLSTMTWSIGFASRATGIKAG